MTYVLWVLLAIIFLILWGIYKIIKAIFRKAKRNQRERKRSKERAKAEREMEELTRKRSEERDKAERAMREFESSVAMTKIIEQRKVFDSSRKYHYETTFMLYFKNGQKTALTVENGSYHYDFLIGKCSGSFSI